MKKNLKIFLASLALVAIVGSTGGIVSANNDMMKMNSSAQAQQAANFDQPSKMFFSDLNVFLKNVQGYVKNNDKKNPNTNTPAADLRVAMNNLLSEHVDVSADVMRKIIDGSVGLDAAKEAQLNNAVQIAEAFGGLYGSEVQAAVTEAFVEHIEFSNEYAEAVDAMDEAAKIEANEELDEYLTDIAVLLSSVIDTLDKETAYTVLRQHEDLMNEAAEQYKSGDYMAAYETEREALKQIQVVSDVLAKGIVDTMPKNF